MFEAVGFQPGGPDSDIVVVRPGSGQREHANAAFIVLEGDSPAARQLRFRPTARRVRVQNVEDVHQPKLSIIWERALDLPVYETPPDAQVFTRDRWSGAPLIAGFRRGAGAVLWVAADPGRNGYERFPFLLQALAGLGLQPPFRTGNLWAFFDSSYRAHADLDFLAPRWRRAGIGALHVAAWHFLDGGQDAYLRALIEACHRNAILVYAWLELPHVSERFWNEHPEWREKTALLQDAHLDWRKLMNLANPACRASAMREVGSLLRRFDWDGANLAELYFESLEGIDNPARFTPLNDDVRREFRQRKRFDPLALFDPRSPQHHSRNAAGARAFLDFRAELARRIQTEWIAELESVRATRPDLDLVLTHVDDYFDGGIRDAIGADSARLLPLLERHDFTFLVEDPATVWHLGPRRYTEIARRYRSLTRRTDKLAVDINVVERYQDVYPTKQQTGTELFQVVRRAADSFPRVAVYFESSILPADLALLPAAAAAVTRAERTGSGIRVELPRMTGLAWEGPALVDGRVWPAADGRTVWLPPGTHSIAAGDGQPELTLVDFNGELQAAIALRDGLEFSYRSSSRAFAALNRLPARMEIDGVPWRAANTTVIGLPRGQHLVRLWVR